MSLTNFSRSISGHIAIVTGAASGMGEATAKLFASEGALVAAIDVNEEGLNRVVAEISSEGKSAKGWILDLSDGEAIKRVFDEIANHFGGIDILVNNAGISIPSPIDDDNYESNWSRSMDILITAQTKTIRASLPYIRKSDNPRIVNIASTEGFGATKFGSPYTAAKLSLIHI